MRRTARWLAAIGAVLIVAFLLLRTADTDPAAMRAKYGGPPSQFLALGNGLTVHLRDEGPRDAPVIVLLHGSNADLHTWTPWVRALASEYRVIRFDQIGHGLTGPNPAGDYAPSAYVDAVQRVADRLDLKRFVLAGSSMGGGVAIGYAVAHPERLDGLVLVDSSGMPAQGQGSGNLIFELAATPFGGWVMQRATPRALVAGSFRSSVLVQQVASEAAIDRTWELLRYPGNRAASATRFAMPRHDFESAQLARIKTPVLIQWGEGDPLIPLEAGQWLQRAIPGSRMIVYPNIGHLPMEEAAEASSRDLRAWLARLPARQVPQD